MTANGFWEATTDERELARWWRRWSRANVAIPTGSGAGNMTPLWAGVWWCLA